MCELVSFVPLLPVVLVLVDVLAGGEQLVKQTGDGCFARAGGARDAHDKRVHGAMNSHAYSPTPATFHLLLSSSSSLLSLSLSWQTRTQARDRRTMDRKDPIPAGMARASDTGGKKDDTIVR